MEDHGKLPQKVNSALVYHFVCRHLSLLKDVKGNIAFRIVSFKEQSTAKNVEMKKLLSNGKESKNGSDYVKADHHFFVFQSEHIKKSFQQQNNRLDGIYKERKKVTVGDKL